MHKDVVVFFSNVRSILSNVLFMRIVIILARLVGVMEAMAASSAYSMLVTTCERSGLKLSENRTLYMHIQDRAAPNPVQKIKAAGQAYAQMEQFVYLGSCIHADADIAAEIKWRRSRTVCKRKDCSKQL